MVFAPGGEQGYSSGVNTYKLYSRDHRGRLAIPKGLVPRVITRIESLGMTVIVTDHRQFGPQHQPDAQVLAMMAPNEMAVAEAMLAVTLMDAWLRQRALRGRER